jgi:MYXO-CTERM domain-containing protein
LLRSGSDTENTLAALASAAALAMVFARRRRK